MDYQKKMIYLTFVHVGKSESGKTSRWVVKNNTNVILGYVYWFSRWRKYIFSSNGTVVLDNLCLEEIRLFLLTASMKHKEEEEIKNG